MRYRIYMVSGKTYDVDQMPKENLENSLLKITTLKWRDVCYINKNHILSIEEVKKHEDKPHDTEWARKNEEYKKTTSKKKFMPLIKGGK